MTKQEGYLDKEEQFKKLVAEFGSMIVNLAFRFVGNKDDAHDITQDVFIKAWNSFESFQGSSSFKTWLYRIGVNESLNFLRKKKVSSFITALESNLALPFFLSENAEQQLIQQEEKNLVRKAIKKLPKNQRIAITLRSLRNLSYEEIAQIMEVSVSSVESLLFRAKNNLKKTLTQYYFSKY